MNCYGDLMTFSSLSKVFDFLNYRIYMKNSSSSKKDIFETVKLRINFLMFSYEHLK